MALSRLIGERYVFNGRMGFGVAFQLDAVPEAIDGDVAVVAVGGTHADVQADLPAACDLYVI